MSEIKESNNIEKQDIAPTDLGKVVENASINSAEIDESSRATAELSDEELNKPIDSIVNGQRDSLDCRSECTYNTGHSYKYADYGYSG